MVKRRKSNKAHIYFTMIISFMSVLLNCFINLYLTPIITNNVGIEAYGFVSLAKNFVMYGNIIMTALNAFAARYMSLAYMNGEIEEYKKYYSTVLISDLIIGGVLLLVEMVCVFNLENLLNVNSDILWNVKILFLLTFATFYITTVSTVFLATGYVKDRLDIVNLFKGLSYIVEIVILLFAFFIFKPQVWYVGLATFVAAFVLFIGTAVATKKLIPESKVELKNYSIPALKKLVLSGIWNSANSMGNALNSGLDLFVSNLMLSPLSMGQVSIAKTIGNLIYTLYATISQPFQPGFLKKYADGDKDGLLEELKYSMKVCGLITNTIFAGFFSLGTIFYSLLIPTQDIALVYKLTVIAMLPCITEGCMYPVYYIYTLTVKNKIPCLVTIAGGLLNVGGMVLLLKFTNLGVYSIVITTAVVMNFINLITNPLYMCHCLKVSKFTFYPSILLNVLCCFIATITMSCIVHFMPVHISWGYFCIQVIICGVVGLVVQMFVCFKPSEVLHLMRKILKKIVK